MEAERWSLGGRASGHGSGDRTVNHRRRRGAYVRRRRRLYVRSWIPNNPLVLRMFQSPLDFLPVPINLHSRFGLDGGLMGRAVCRWPDLCSDEPMPPLQKGSIDGRQHLRRVHHLLVLVAERGKAHHFAHVPCQFRRVQPKEVVLSYLRDCIADSIEMMLVGVGRVERRTLLFELGTDAGDGAGDLFGRGIAADCTVSRAGRWW